MNCHKLLLLHIEGLFQGRLLLPVTKDICVPVQSNLLAVHYTQEEEEARLKEEENARLAAAAASAKKKGGKKGKKK